MLIVPCKSNTCGLVKATRLLYRVTEDQRSEGRGLAPIAIKSDPEFEHQVSMNGTSRKTLQMAQLGLMLSYQKAAIL
jgi:hypothetical protein